jgi:hypothetical protein
LGYSLYDTIIVFDRVRENIPRMPRAAFSQIVNRSMSEVLTRSIATTSCTLLPVVALLLFGGSTLQDFAFALLIGVASGAYSSIFIASPVLTHWKEREPIYRHRRHRIETDYGVVAAYAASGADVEPARERARRRAGRLSDDGPDAGVSAAEFEQMKRDIAEEEAEPTGRTSILTRRLAHTRDSQTGSGQTGSGQTGSGQRGSGQRGSGRSGSGRSGSGSGRGRAGASPARPAKGPTPAADQPTAPGNGPTAPADQPTAPGSAPTAPANQPTAPVNGPTPPGNGPSAPENGPAPRGNRAARRAQSPAAAPPAQAPPPPAAPPRQQASGQPVGDGEPPAGQEFRHAPDEAENDAMSPSQKPDRPAKPRARNRRHGRRR